MIYKHYGNVFIYPYLCNLYRDLFNSLKRDFRAFKMINRILNIHKVTGLYSATYYTDLSIYQTKFLKNIGDRMEATRYIAGNRVNTRSQHEPIQELSFQDNLDKIIDNLRKQKFQEGN